MRSFSGEKKTEKHVGGDLFVSLACLSHVLDYKTTTTVQHKSQLLQGFSCLIKKKHNLCTLRIIFFNNNNTLTLTGMAYKGIHLFVYCGLLYFLSSWDTTSALQCGQCFPESCIPPVGCPGGLVLDACDCCMECGRQENDTCGDSYGFLGRCDKGLICVISPTYGQPVDAPQDGICTRMCLQFKNQL